MTSEIVAVESPSFDAFWKLYPRKTAKLHATKMWKRLDESEKIAALEAIPKHHRYWQNEWRAPSMIPHAGTWLNGKRWEDELPITQRRDPRAQRMACLTGRMSDDATDGSATRVDRTPVLALDGGVWQPHEDHVG